MQAYRCEYTCEEVLVGAHLQAVYRFLLHRQRSPNDGEAQQDETRGLHAASRRPRRQRTIPPCLTLLKDPVAPGIRIPAGPPLSSSRRVWTCESIRRADFVRRLSSTPLIRPDSLRTSLSSAGFESHRARLPFCRALHVGVGAAGLARSAATPSWRHLATSRGVYVFVGSSDPCAAVG